MPPKYGKSQNRPHNAQNCPLGPGFTSVEDHWSELNEVLIHKCCICRLFFEEFKKQQHCSEMNARLPIAMSTRVTSLILAVLLSFLLFKEGRVEAVGEFFFLC